MAEIVPTILTNDKNLYRKQYELYSTFAKRIQVDITDGVFTAFQTIDVSNAWREENWAKMDLHMMVMRPSEYLQTIQKIKPSLVIFHAEAKENLIPSFQFLKKLNIRTGLAILKQTYPGKVAPYLKEVDHCLIFAGNLGEMGGKADMLQIEKIPIIRSINSSLEIGWDGGANMSNVRELAHSEIDIINCGSAIANAPDPKKAYTELTEETDKLGVKL